MKKKKTSFFLYIYIFYLSECLHEVLAFILEHCLQMDFGDYSGWNTIGRRLVEALKYVQSLDVHHTSTCI